MYQLIIYKEPYAKHRQTKNYIQNITAYVDVLSNTVKIIKIPRLAELGVPQYVIDHFVEAIQSKKKNHCFKYESVNGGNMILGFGTIEVDGEKARYAYIEAHTSGNLIFQKVNHPIEKCWESPFGQKRCWKEDNWEIRDFKEVELRYIKSGLRVESMEKIKSIIERLK